MKKLYTYLLIVLLGSSYGQQLPQYSQYMLNQMAINPAVAGKDEYAEARSNNRLQWIGITDAPRTYVLTVQGPIEEKHMGLGMTLFTDITGPTRRTGLSFSYAYHLKLQKDLNLSMAASAGILQWGIDGNKLSLKDDGDGQLLTTYQNAYVPDFGAGVYLHKKDQFYLGFSLPQLYQAPIKLYDGAYKNSKVVSQFNLNGGYMFTINNDFKLEPSFLFKYEFPAPPKLDIGVRGLYRDEIWAGTAYRHNDAISVMAGYMYQNYLLVGYSYDITTTRLKKYYTGTHEVMLGIRFSRKQSATWEKGK